MTIMRFSPLGELVQLQERMNRMLGDLRPATGREEIFSGAWTPAVDIYETKDEMVLKIDLPEIDRKDVNIKIDDNVLTLTGERTMDKDIKEEHYHRIERSYGSFSRSFTLPNTIDREKIKASFKDGVLSIHLPKKEETKPKEVRIEIG